jgi:N-acetylmuramoyl-L-alanine amidase
MSRPLRRVCIDPGHGGKDPGAVGPTGLKEADVNLMVGRLLFSKLLLKGYETCMTRSNDFYVPLSRRVHISNNMEVDAFISLHCNAAENPKAEGFEVWTSPGQTRGDLLAECIVDRWNVHFPDMRIRKDESDGDSDKEGRLYVVRKTKAPACLVEMGFISNEREEELLSSVNRQEEMAHCILLGVEEYFELPA